ncbi:MAG: hypothetical protein HDS89_00345 [Bacteroidales bacterium]|nr:hypothetical protein [Bacteroidales bacterium]
MVWAQLALLPIIYMMLCVTEHGVLWRWNLNNWLMVSGYLIGLLALPFSRGLEKPNLLKWWLRIDFWLSFIPAILALPLLFYPGILNIDAEDEDYVLYHTQGVMMAAPHYSLGRREGLFIDPMHQVVRINDYNNDKIDCFKVDTLRGCFYGLSRGGAQTSWVLPLDSMKYRKYAVDITELIDSLYQAQPLCRDYYHGTFVFPDNFAEINYDSFSISYKDSINYDIDRIDSDSLRVTIINNGITELSYPKDSLGNLSPKDVRTFIDKLKGGKQ